MLATESRTQRPEYTILRDTAQDNARFIIQNIGFWQLRRQLVGHNNLISRRKAVTWHRQHVASPNRPDDFQERDTSFSPNRST